MITWLKRTSSRTRIGNSSSSPLWSSSFRQGIPIRFEPIQSTEKDFRTRIENSSPSPVILVVQTRNPDFRFDPFQQVGDVSTFSPTINRFFTLSNRDWGTSCNAKTNNFKAAPAFNLSTISRFCHLNGLLYNRHQTTSSGSCSWMQCNKDKLTLQCTQQSTTVANPQSKRGEWSHKVGLVCKLWAYRLHSILISKSDQCSAKTIAS